jgi:hypothetical protein
LQAFQLKKPGRQQMLSKIVQLQILEIPGGHFENAIRRRTYAARTLA